MMASGLITWLAFLVVATFVGNFDELFIEFRSVKLASLSIFKLFPLSRTEITSGGLMTSSYCDDCCKS